MADLPNHLTERCRDRIDEALDAYRDLLAECGGLIARASVQSDVARLERLRSRADARVVGDDEHLDDLG